MRLWFYVGCFVVDDRRWHQEKGKITALKFAGGSIGARSNQ
jgi:hypothetical protein